jgi:16S rRNA (cytidine1402-2'-O)-methyltransferase
MPRRSTGATGVSEPSRNSAAPSAAPPPNRGAESGAADAIIPDTDRWRPGLYVVATPIGNLRDITLRALEALRRADAVVCEDTRVTGKLLAHHGLASRLIAYHDHNAPRVRPHIIRRLEHGETFALVSDAGTPLVADPGYRLVQAALAAGIHVTVFPGPSSILAALVLAGLPTDRFMFAGFLPSRSGARRAALRELRVVPATLVFLESPNRLAEALADMRDELGDRDAAVVREITKMFEESRRGKLSALARTYAAAAPKGEIVVVVGPPEQGPASAEELDAQLATALASMTVRNAAETVAAATGLAKRDVYRRALELAAKSDDDG